MLNMTLSTINPLNFTAEPFLTLYAILVVATLLAVLGVRAWAKRSPQADTFTPLTTSELAYLSGGERMSVVAGLATLCGYGLAGVSTTPTASLVARPESNHALDDFQRALAAAIGAHDKGRSVSRLPLALWTQVRDMADDLQDRALIVRKETARQARLLSTILLVMTGGFGVAKVIVGLMRDKPVGFLVLMIGVLGLAGWLLVMKANLHRTRAGNAVLAAERRRLSVLKTRAGETPDEFGTAVALFGLVALQNTTLATFAVRMQPATPSSMGGSGGGDGYVASGCGSGGGSGCGGGGGSGCGGCGGCS